MIATSHEAQAAAIAAQVPGWEDSALSPLVSDVVSPVHRGVEAALWLVRPASGPAGVLRIARSDMAGLIDASAAVAGARLASEAGVGPRVLWSDAALGAVAMEHMGEGWRTATMADLQRPEVLAAVLDACRRLHGAGRLDAVHDVFAEVRRLRGLAAAEGVPLPADAWWLCDAVADIGEAVAAAGFDPAPARNDGASSNVMIGPAGAVRLLDYDRAGMGDPLYDLGVLLAEACAFEEEARRAALRWTGGDEAALSRALCYGAADDVMWALWGAICDHRRSRLHVEFRKYSEWRFLRARAALTDRRQEERLRRIGRAA